MNEYKTVALRALELAEQEMRMAGWIYFQSDNVGRMDAMQAVRDAIAVLTAEPDMEEPIPSKVANHVSQWQKVEQLPLRELSDKEIERVWDSIDLFKDGGRSLIKFARAVIEAARHA